ncbi:hypothetical protein DUI87_09064 [Hirundo rustica rustica]|uniref:Uncharacterized protein n=1 Tax=Hirundo rustica rustica TaxID=333673 RepID=A0A3M0KTB3_HIRRU|nr:hypothetical protein DUI87_09064 [Hirundo rustica rustica]
MFPLMQPETVSSRSVSCCLEKETNPQLTTATFQGVVESDKVTSESPFLQAKQAQAPSAVPHRVCAPSPSPASLPPLDALKHLNVLPKLRGPGLDTSRCGLSSAEYRGRMTSLLMLATPFLTQARMPLALLATWAHCWIMFSCCHQHPWVPFLLGTVQPCCPQPVTLQGVIVSKVQDLALGLIKLLPIGLCPSIQSFQISLQGMSTFQQIDTRSQLSVICKFTSERLDAYIHVINKNIEQSWPQHRPLRDTTGAWPQLDAAPFTTTLWARPSRQFLTQ